MNGLWEPAYHIDLVKIQFSTSDNRHSFERGMSCIGRLHNIMKKNILILEGRETIGGGQIITKKICKILSESNNVSVFIPGEKNAISD